MSDSPSNPGGRPARPAIPPFRGPAGSGAAGGAARPAVPPARAPLTPGDRTRGPGGLPPRPAVSPLPPASARPSSRRATPARSPYVTPSGSQAPPPAVRPAALTPVLARPEVLPAPVHQIIPSVAGTAGDPLAGLDIIEAAPPPEPSSGAADERAVADASASGNADWLSPEGALRGEFGELVESIPQRPTAQAPVFPTPPAPWPALSPNATSTATSGTDADAVADLDAGFEEVLGTSPRPETGRGAVESTAGPTAGLDVWMPEADEQSTPEQGSPTPGKPGGADLASEEWAASYGAEADAIHGEPEAAPPGPDARRTPQASDPATYLASEWPEPPVTDPSTLPTPVVPGPAVLAASEAAGRMPTAPARRDPLFEAAPQEEDAFGWGRTPQETPPPGTAMGEIGGAPTGGASGGVDDWAFAAPDTGADLGGRPVVTASSLAAAEALERVAVQLREGTLRADGFSPALGEAAALSAVLAALLGVDARWDVQR